MFRSKKKLIVSGIVTLIILFSLIAAGGYYLAIKDTSPQSTGPTPVTDHRELPVAQVTITQIADKLDAPWGMHWLPDGKLLITERFGTLLLLNPETGQRSEISGVPEVFAAGQGGLLDATIHPEFENNQLIYLSYSDGSEEGNRLKVAHAQLHTTTLENIEVIFQVAQNKTGAQHYGTRFAWLPDGTLLFSVGDGGNPPTQYNGQLIREQAQSLSAHLGKVIRIKDDGHIPADNPFNGRPDARHEIWSYGHRNVQGLTVDSKRGSVFATEHGSKGGDELNLITAGANYGWPRTTYSTEYNLTGTPISEHQALPHMQDPVAVWTPSIAPSGIVYYHSDRYDQWHGSLFVGAMALRADKSIMAYSDTPAGAVLRLEVDASGQTQFQELIEIGPYRVRDIDQCPDGFLYVLLDDTIRPNQPGTKAGSLIRISP